MAGTLSRVTWERVARLRRKRGYRNAATLGLVLLGPVLAALTFIVMGPLADAGAGGAEPISSRSAESPRPSPARRAVMKPPSMISP